MLLKQNKISALLGTNFMQIICLLSSSFIHTHTHTHIYTCEYIYIYTHIHVYIYIYTHTHIYILVVFFMFVVFFFSLAFFCRAGMKKNKYVKWGCIPFCKFRFHTWFLLLIPKTHSKSSIKGFLPLSKNYFKPILYFCLPKYKTILPVKLSFVTCKVLSNFSQLS